MSVLCKSKCFKCTHKENLAIPGSTVHAPSELTIKTRLKCRLWWRSVKDVVGYVHQSAKYVEVINSLPPTWREILGLAGLESDRLPRGPRSICRHCEQHVALLSRIIVISLALWLGCDKRIDLWWDNRNNRSLPTATWGISWNSWLPDHTRILSMNLCYWDCFIGWLASHELEICSCKNFNWSVDPFLC